MKKTINSESGFTLLELLIFYGDDCSVDNRLHNDRPSGHGFLARQELKKVDIHQRLRVLHEQLNSHSAVGASYFLYPRLLTP